ncbi:rhamnan synthesis F family protein [Bradyrhizobium sp.]
MSVEREDGAIRRLARKLPPWAKRLARRLLDVNRRISKLFVAPMAARLAFPTAAIVPNRETIILIVHEASRTGAPILGWNLVLNLRRKYNMVVVLKRGGAILPAFEAIAAAVICLPDNFPMHTDEMEVLASKLLRNYAPKYAIANSIESRFIVSELEALDIPVVTLVHEFSSIYRPIGLFCELFSTASVIVFPARIVADSSATDYKILRGRDFNILPQGQSKLPSAPVASNSAARLSDSRAISSERYDEFLVIGIGTIIERKGVDLFIEVAAAAKRIFPGRKLSFAWIGAYAFEPYLDQLKEQIDNDELSDTFHFLGEFENLDPIYDRADVFFLASRVDPLPNVAIDAALRGLPVVCFDQASGIAEILSEHDGTRGLVVPHLDTAAAARLICDLAADLVQLGKFSAAVADIAYRHFDMESYVKKIDELGLRARRSLDQIGRDLKTIRQHGAFNPSLGHESNSKSVDAAILKYLRRSRILAPWNKVLAGTFARRPLEGFNPLIYARENPDFDPQGLEDPLAHFARSGRPPGRWTHRVITPAASSAFAIRQAKVAVHGHFHYPELLPDFIHRLNQNKNTFDLFLTTTSQAKADQLAKYKSQNVQIKVVDNRGRDLAPFLRGLSEGLYSEYDVVGHFHSKRSPNLDGELGTHWRNFLWEHLVGGKFAMADTILRIFAENPRVGLVFAEDPNLNGWDENLKIAEDLAARMELLQPLPMHFDFPIGTMFWARPAALKPLIRLNLCDTDFPMEPLPIDGTLLHALERIIPFAAADAGFEYATTYVRSSKR